MRHEAFLCYALLFASFLGVGCSSPPEPAPPPAVEAPVAVNESVATPAPAVELTEPTVDAAVETTPPPIPKPTPTPTPAASTPPPSPVVPPPTPSVADTVALVTDVGGLVEVGTTIAGVSRIGSEKCKICHKLQFASWSESAHALRTPPLDCESCHGPGSLYKGLKVMKDPQAARAAGMVIPAASFCAQCHTGGWTDGMLTQTHEHKAAPS